MSERITGSHDDALYKSTYTLLYFTTEYILLSCQKCRRQHHSEAKDIPEVFQDDTFHTVLVSESQCKGINDLFLILSGHLPLIKGIVMTTTIASSL